MEETKEIFDMYSDAIEEYVEAGAKMNAAATAMAKFFIFDNFGLNSFSIYKDAPRRQNVAPGSPARAFAIVKKAQRSLP